MNAFDYFFEHTRHLKKDFVVGPKENITYHDLCNRSEKLASVLRQEIGTGQNILLVSPNSVFFITAYMAILRSGNVVIPLNPEIEQKNLDEIQHLCQSRLAITTKMLASKIRFGSISVWDENRVDKITGAPSQRSLPKEETPADQLAEIIFTSGSTGEPKGVMISHGNLIANTGSIVEYLELTERDIMLVVLPFYYCYGLSLLHSHLRIGGSIVLNNMFIMLGGVINDLKCYKCTGFAGVPSHFQILLRKSDSFRSTSFPDLRYVTQAGGKLHNVFIKEFTETFPDIRFNVMYGQTEATARLSWLPPEKLPEKLGSCGKGIPGVTLRVVNDQDEPVETCETGEVVAQGDNIMLGYYKDPETTAKTLRNGWLHTGDLGRIDEDGFIFLIARKKEIIKVGGRRVSPKEIEEVIVSMPEVIDCRIESIYNEILGETMKAIVIIREQTEGKSMVTVNDIKSWCANRLAPFKIPQIIELNTHLTIKATGKR